MERIKKTARQLLIGAVLLWVPANLHAWEPNPADLQQAVRTGKFTAYFDNLTKWLSQQVSAAPGGPSELALQTLLKEPVVASALGQRTLLLKYGVGNVEGFTKAGAGNQAFLLWVMQNARTLDLFLIGGVPIGLRQREDNSFGLPGGALDIWKRIYEADPESRDGLYLRLAMATAMNPPGTGCRGAGQPEQPEDPLSRYFHFKKAHQHRELLPSFDTLAVWELRHVTCSMASNADLAWGREMVNTWNPEFRKNELVVDTTSQVWRRNSPIAHANSYRNVLAGGGKCGPRSSWSVFICQAFGIPATGVGQPAHACVAFRKPDGVWATAYGRSWAASNLLGMSGNEFVEGMNARLQPERFALVEHLRWLALALPAASQGPLLELAKAITKAPPVLAVPSDRKADEATPLGSLEAPKNCGDNYVARIRGFLYPPATGDYVFKIASDDQADLFLSLDANPTAKKLIAYHREFTGDKEFNKFPTQKSEPITLQRGKAYYLEVVHQEGGGDDHLAVAWSGPGIAERVISAAYLTPGRGAAKGSILREVWQDQKPPTAPVAVPPPVAAPVPPPVFSPVGGVIHVDAEAYFDNGGCAVFGGHPGVVPMDSYPAGTGKQIHFAANMGSVWAGYKIQVPETGNYELVAKVATVNFDQYLLVRSYGAMHPVKSATASAVYKGWVKDLGPQQATDNNPGTRWAVNEGVDQAWLEIDLGEPKPISTCMIDERFFNRIGKFKVEYKAGTEWKPLFEDTNIGIAYEKDFPTVKTQQVRLSTLETRENGGPTIWEFSVGTVKNGTAWLNLPCTYGLWETTKPVDIRLVKGAQTIWFLAPFQRGVSLKSFDLRAKGTTQAVSGPARPAPAPAVPSSQLKNASGEDPE